MELSLSLWYNPYALNLYMNSGYEKRGFAHYRKVRFILM